MKRYAAVTALLLGCTAPDPGPADPNAGLLRDFLDGKFDAAGHPINGKVIEIERACGTRRLTSPCAIDVPAGARSGELVVNARMLVRGHAGFGAIATIAVVDDSGRELAKETLTVSRLRGRLRAIDVPVTLSSGVAAKVVITPHSGADIDVEYVEVFPKHFKLVVAPGSGVYGDRDVVTFELPAGRRLDRLDVSSDGGAPIDLLARLDQLIASRVAQRTSTTFRTIISVAVGDLIPERGEVAELAVRAGGNAARAQLRRRVAECRFDGDPLGQRVLITGFQPFPADGTHDNISAVAVTAMNPANLRGGQIMKLILPVEYDRAASTIADAIARCAPDIVISFGQGGGSIALEHTAYNLQDTGEIAGGAPDNRGVIRAATPIDDTAASERATLLPIDAIRDALEAIGEQPADSTDPGRYICNNVMFSNIGVMGDRDGRAGFIHLPFTSEFDDAVRARFGRVVEVAVQATLDN